MSNLNQLYRKYTGILTDVEGAIAAAKTEQEKRDLYNKLTWRIPGGLVRNNYKDLLDELAARLIDSVSPVQKAQSTVIVEETPAEEPVVDECPLYEEAPVDEGTKTRRSRSSKVVEE